jgi:hypothetical protein
MSKIIAGSSAYSIGFPYSESPVEIEFDHFLTSHFNLSLSYKSFPCQPCSKGCKTTAKY